MNSHVENSNETVKTNVLIGIEILCIAGLEIFQVNKVIFLYKRGDISCKTWQVHKIQVGFV